MTAPDDRARDEQPAEATCSCCGGDPNIVCDACEQHSCWAGQMYCDEYRTAGMKRKQPVPAGDQCRPVTVTGIDGEEVVVPVLGGDPMDETTRGYFEQVVQAAQRRYQREHPEVEQEPAPVGAAELRQAERLRQRLDEDGQLWRTAFEEGRQQGVKEVRAYMLMDLWVALGHEPADPEVAEPGTDRGEVWARALEEVRERGRERDAARAEMDRLRVFDEATRRQLADVLEQNQRLRARDEKAADVAQEVGVIERHGVGQRLRAIHPKLYGLLDELARAHGADEQDGGQDQ